MGALDSNPKTIAGILLAVGILGVGAILTFGFFNDSTMLGVGVVMIVLGAAGLLLGTINLCALDKSGRKKSGDKSIAPERIPDVVPRAKGEEPQDDPEGSLYYEPCSVSPPRGARSIMLNNTMDGAPSPNREGSIVPTGANNGPLSMLSPYDQRSFPVPNIPPGATPGKVVIESYTIGDRRRVVEDAADSSRLSGPNQSFKQRLAGRLEPPHPAEARFTQQQSGNYGGVGVGTEMTAMPYMQKENANPNLPKSNSLSAPYQQGSGPQSNAVRSSVFRAPSREANGPNPANNNNNNRYSGEALYGGASPPRPPPPTTAPPPMALNPQLGPLRPLPVATEPQMQSRRFNDGGSSPNGRGGPDPYLNSSTLHDEDALSPAPSSRWRY